MINFSRDSNPFTCDYSTCEVLGIATAACHAPVEGLGQSRHVDESRRGRRKGEVEGVVEFVLACCSFRV